MTNGAPSKMWSIYEGSVTGANPRGFGRMINGLNNFSFVGYFSSATSNSEFKADKAAQGTGIYYELSDMAQYGIWADDQEFKKEAPGVEDMTVDYKGAKSFSYFYVNTK